ncbi:M28 family peptidase [Brevibacillus composti]|uniref:histidine kinase n=2 Tax=Brevibacillus composti TaxID=2796470 RepID=A0ABX7Z137_9BACL|nr:M28 family peptidase [Brevibacillus composti]QUO40746.1 M28 family peptidase [Brevibacillus composti]
MPRSRTRPARQVISGGGDYLIAEINRLGLEPQVQTAEVSKTDGNRNLVTAATVRNILVRVAGTSHTSAILVSAHYDSEPGSYGANDDGVAVAAMLETLRMPQAGPKPKNDLIFLFSDGEELNLLGAEAFWRDHPWARDVSLVLNYESRGSRGPSVIWDAGPGIAEADLPYIFDRLYTGEASRNRSSSGSGLGLAIVKRLVERQRGRIDVQSIPDVRTSFEVRLPRAK